MKLPLPDFGKEIKVGDPSFVYKGIYNAIYWDGEDPYRPRVENLVIKNGKEVFLRLYDEVNDGFVYRYRIPGGSLDNDSTKIQQAENETNEEALLKVKNIAATGVAYFESFPEGYKLKKGDICLMYKGNITDVFVSEYAGKMDKSKIDPHDLDDDMATNGKFHYITQIAQLLRQEHVDALLNSPLVDDVTKTLMLRLRRGDLEAKKSYRNLYDEIIPSSKKYDSLLESVNSNKIPRSTKLYHGSPIQNIKTIEPHVSRSYADYGPVVFASEYPEFVACFGTSWNDTVMRQSSTTHPDGTTEITLRVIDKSIIKTWDRPCSMYELVNDGSFTRIPNHPREVVSGNKIRVKREIKFDSFWDMIEPYRINVVDYNTGEPIVRKGKNDKTIYMVTSHYISPFGNTVRAVTGGYYNHAGLALDKKLDKMYTYSRRTNTNEGRILGGFAVESFKDFRHGKLDDIDIKVIACDVTKDQFDYVKERMNFLSKNIPKTHYNFANLLTSAFKIPINDNLSSDLVSICSVFVATVMKAIGHPVSGKPVNLVTPDDIAACDAMSGFKTVYTGGVDKFTSVTEQNNVYELQPVSKDVKIYHGSPVQNIKEVKAFHNDRIYSELGPVIFTSSYPEFAACYGTRWDDTKMKQNMDWDNEKLTSVSISLTDPDITKDWNKPCSLYELENHGNFKQLPNHPCEIISPNPAKVIKETKFNSFWDMAKEFGIKIISPDGNELMNVMIESTLCRTNRAKQLARAREMMNPVSEIGAFSSGTSGGGGTTLASLRRDKIDRHIIDTLSKQFKSLEHVRVDENCEGYIYFDRESSPVAIINVEELPNGRKIVQNLTVVGTYKDSGLEDQLIGVATRELGANFATVSKKNEELIEIYKDNGFREVGSSMISVSLQRGEITEESTQASTMNKNFKKKTGGNFEFIDIHSPKAKQYLPKDKNYSKSFKKYYSITNGEIVIDRDTGKVAGCVYVGGGTRTSNKNYGFIQTLEVYDGYKGYGLGKTLLDHAITKYHAEDLTCYKDNEVALNMYKNRGFVIIGYGNDGKNDYWMKLKSKLSDNDEIIIEGYNDGFLGMYKKSLIGKKVYHGSLEKYEMLEPTGLDLGNKLEESGWSLYTWLDRDNAYGWSIFAFIRSINSKFNYNFNVCAVGSHIPTITQSGFEAVLEYIRNADVSDRLFYVYDVEITPDMDIGLGHSSNTDRCVTIRTPHIKPSNIETCVLTEAMFRKYVKVKSDKEVDRLATTNANQRALTFLMDNDLMYQFIVNKDTIRTIKKAIKSGDLQPGESLQDFLDREGLKIEKADFLTRLSMSVFDKQTVRKIKSVRDRFVSESTVSEGYNDGFLGMYKKSLIGKFVYHGALDSYDILEPTGLDIGNKLEEPGWSLFTWTNFENAMGWGVFITLCKVIRAHNIGHIVWSYKSCIPVMTKDGYDTFVAYLNETPADERSFYIHEIKITEDMDIGLGHASNTNQCVTIKSPHVKPYTINRYVVTESMLKRYSKIVTNQKQFHSEKYFFGGANTRLLSVLMDNDLLWQAAANNPTFKIIKKAIKDGDLKPGESIQDFLDCRGLKLEKADFMTRLQMSAFDLDTIRKIKATKDKSVSESTRSQLPDSEFGVPSQRKYELDTKKHVLSAIKLFNWVDEEHEKELATNIIKKIDEFHISDDEIHCTEKNRFYKYWKGGK